MGNLCIGGSSSAAYEPDISDHREITAQEFQTHLQAFRTSEVGLTEEQQTFVSQSASPWISNLQRNLYRQTEELIQHCEHYQQLRLNPSVLGGRMTRMAAEWASLRTELQLEIARVGWSASAIQNVGQSASDTTGTESAMPVIVEEPTSSPGRRGRRIGVQNF